MDGGHDWAAELDEQIEALHAGLQADQPLDVAAETTIELVELLAERYQHRLASGDQDGAINDLDESADRLTSMLARCPPGSPWYAALARRAGSAYEERWAARDNPEDRDAAIDCLTGALSAVSGAVPELDATLARLHGVRAAGTEPGAERDADLDAAIAHGRSGLTALEPAQYGLPATAGDDIPDPDLRAELRLFLGLALSERFSAALGRLPDDTGDGISAARSWRAEAISVLDAVLGEIPPTDPVAVVAAEALGRALYDRYSDSWPAAAHPDPADLDGAIDLLTTGATAEPDRRTVVYLIFALSDRLDLRADSGDLDRLIIWCQRLLDSEQEVAADNDFYRDLLITALSDRADINPRTRDTDLAAAIKHLETALAAVPPGDPSRAPLLARLAHACWDRLDGDDSKFDLMDQMIAYADQAWTLLSPDAEDRVQIGLYLAFGTYERMRRDGAAFDLPAVSRAIEVLTEIEPLLTDEATLHPQVEVLLGVTLVSRAQFTGDSADLAAARPWLLQAATSMLATPGADDPHWFDLAQTLGAGLTALAALGMDAGHRDQAIGLLAKLVDSADPDPVRAAMTRGTLGMFLTQRASFTGNGAELDNGIAHLTASYDMAPAGHPYRAVAGANLAAALMSRFLERGQAEDVDAARFYMTLVGPAKEQIRPLMADVDVVIAGNRGLIALAEGMLGNAGALDEAVTCLRTAFAILPPSHPHRGRIRADLGCALAYRSISSTARPGDLDEAGRLLQAAAAGMTGTDVLRPATLLRAGGVLTLAGVKTGDQQLLRQAVGYLKDALDGTDQRFGNRFRFAALLGGTAYFLYRASGDRSDLDTAVAWLQDARRDLDSRPWHPQYANCLIGLSRVYRAKGDAGPSRETGLATLRSRARDLLMQSGTARSIGFARRAATEAAEVAAWCLEDGRVDVAIEAIELGRGLILHASTSIAEFPDLLAAAGYEDLAAEWREAALTGNHAPWDAGIPAAEHLPGLLSGAGLEVPDDLRSRAFAALTGSGAEGRLLTPPSIAELAVALSQSGADALVYLLEPSDDRPGCAVIVPAGHLGEAAEPTMVPLPLLLDSARGPLQSYISACADVHSGAPPEADGQDPSPQEPTAIERWCESLGQLCDWAWPAVMEPVLSFVRPWVSGRLSRLVLVPAGVLSLVPWHAARERPDNAGPRHYALHETVISYAASGRQLRETAERRALPLDAGAVVVGDPSCGLPGARVEAQAILSRCYPAGRYLGPEVADWDRVAAGPGTPEEILRELPAVGHLGAAVLHLGCHGVVDGSAPGRSYLILGGGQDLMVDAILRQAGARAPGGAGGLISLAACTSDMTLGDYDEALTPATAFLAAGAVTVVGARWQVPDESTPLLMFMFHHLLTHEARSPRDALRDAQLWMLNPARVPPPQMPEELAKRARRPALPDPVAWAGFVHQGK